MFRRVLLISGISAMAALAGAGFSHVAPVPQSIVHKKTRRGLFNGTPYFGDLMVGGKGAGITMARQKRNATKRRNQLRHKQRASRG